MKLLTALALALLPLAFACRTRPDYERPLPDGWSALILLEPDEPRPAFGAEWHAREELQPALERSIAWTRKPHARQFFPIAGVDHALALASLERFAEHLEAADGPEDFERRLGEEFDVYKSAGWNGRGGGVLYTGYFTPILKGSLEPRPGFGHPLYGLPDDLVKGPNGEILGQRTAAGVGPYPTRRTIEASAMLEGRGLELVWLQTPLDAYIAHVNGSAFVELPDGSMARFGYAGKNGREYTSLGKELVEAKEVRKGQMSLGAIRRWAERNPGKVAEFLARNDSYVFFTPITGNPRGSLNVEVSPGRSLATDKSLFPRGALVFVDTRLPAEGDGTRAYQRLMLDQDTGGAIRTAGRADIYLGIGPEVERLAGRTRAEGQLYYLFLKPEVAARLAPPAP